MPRKSRPPVLIQLRGFRKGLCCVGVVLAVSGIASLLPAGSAPATPRQQPSGGTPPELVRRDVTHLLERQRDAWNRGDLDQFLLPYWNSEQLTFCSGGVVRRGFAATKARYRQAYPNREAMGQLEFSELEVSVVAPGAVLVLGNWTLTRDVEPLAGNFSLVLKRIADEWKIVHDHTSRRTESP